MDFQDLTAEQVATATRPQLQNAIANLRGVLGWSMAETVEYGNGFCPEKVAAKRIQFTDDEFRTIVNAMYSLAKDQGTTKENA